jgi:hypothetical protein
MVGIGHILEPEFTEPSEQIIGSAVGEWDMGWFQTMSLGSPNQLLTHRF